MYDHEGATTVQAMYFVECQTSKQLW